MSEFKPQPRTCSTFDCSRPARPGWVRCNACLEEIARVKRAEIEERDREDYAEWEGMR